MEETYASGYWCHVCSQLVNPIMEIETVKCPICQSGFVEEMSSPPPDFVQEESDSDRALSLWAPIFLGMMHNSRRSRHQLRSLEFEEGDETNLDQLESMVRSHHRRNSSATILQRMILINPFNQTIIIDGSYDESQTTNAPIGSLGDYFSGPGFDLLLQHLADNDPNRYGTPPATKEAVEALPDVRNKDETMQCCVCLDVCEIGCQVKEMPCNHMFHSECILTWLQIHSSCPVCRYQLPGEDESKVDSDGSGNNNNNNSYDNSSNVYEGGNERNDEHVGRFPGTLLWPLGSLFSSSTSQSSTGNENLSDPHGNGN